MSAMSVMSETGEKRRAGTHAPVRMLMTTPKTTHYPIPEGFVYGAPVMQLATRRCECRDMQLVIRLDFRVEMHA
ncbi:Protein of unknown function [Pyronema omphalodes CBS 100304]|uniref:Uncharacterized protein n=1 Tax=Pyronema omphalodes (strain CBS 100304) TaxID=1076935 RepID=U4LUE7_PYROM|nr:Protein of unknown function [Pyronema omphalodes CBS 100304]